IVAAAAYFMMSGSEMVGTEATPEASTPAASKPAETPAATPAPEPATSPPATTEPKNCVASAVVLPAPHEPAKRHNVARGLKWRVRSWWSGTPSRAARTARVRLGYALGRCGVPRKHRCRAHRSPHQFATAVGTAAAGQPTGGAVGAERAFERADQRVRSVRRQVLVAALAIGPERQHDGSPPVFVGRLPSNSRRRALRYWQVPRQHGDRRQGDGGRESQHPEQGVEAPVLVDEGDQR